MRQLASRLFTAFILSVLCTPVFSAQQASLNELDNKDSLYHYVRQVWTTSDGLPHNSINAMAQDNDGYLWFGTWQGPTRFNGREFDIFDDIRVTGLPDLGIYTVAINPCNGSLYVGGSRGGLSRYDEGEWQKLESITAFINQVRVDKNCNLWVSSNEYGLFFYENDRLTATFTSEHGLPSDVVYQSLLDNDNNLWVATNNGLAVKTANHTRFEVVTDVPGQLIREVQITPNGKIIAGTQNGLFLQQDGLNFSPYIDEVTASVSSIFYDKNNNLWFGTYRNGLFRYSEGNLENININSGLPNNHVLDIIQDHEGSIWVSTHGGLVQFRDAPFSSYDRTDGLAGNFVRAVMQWRGNVYVGSSSGLSVIDQQGIRKVGTGTALASASVLSMAVINDKLFVGTYTSGVYVWDGERIVQHYSRDTGLLDNEVRKIAYHPKFGMFFGGPLGISHISPTGEYNSISALNGLPNNYTTALMFDSAGTLWSGSVRGLTSITITQTEDGYNYDADVIDLTPLDDAKMVFQIQEIGKHLLFATDRGLILYDSSNQSWRIFNREEGLPFDNFLSVAADGKGNIWLGSNRGAILIFHDDFSRSVDNPSLPLKFQRFSEVDGMSNSQVNSGGPSFYQTQSGRLWMATAKGVSVVDPESFESVSAMPPPTVIANVEADGKSINYGEQVPADTLRIEFDYAGLGFMMSEHIEYQVRLVGFDKDWVNKHTEAKTEYTALPANDYLFQVRASYPGGQWSEPANFAFSRSTFFWQRPSTWVLFAVIFLALVFLAVRARIQFLNRSRHQLERMVKAKTAELESLARQDALTGLGNRRAFDELLRHEIRRSHRNGSHLSLAILDVDFFKQINDRFLHTVGDQVLIELSLLLQRILRDVDYAARWGGEEFAILLPDTSLSEAVEACERVRVAVQNHDFTDLLDDMELTVSIGVASNEHYVDHGALLMAADQALYEAKTNGRNRTESK